jgi:hypothetical protein
MAVVATRDLPGLCSPGAVVASSSYPHTATTMPLLDRLSDLVHKVAPPKSSKPSTTLAGGIGNGHGMVPFDDNVSAKTYLTFSNWIYILASLICEETEGTEFT